MEVMTKERREAYVEVLEILKHMDKKYISKIPLELREFFERNASIEYEIQINNKKTFEEQNLKEITINILAMLNINYWCESEEHKQELLRKYHENDLRKEEELRKRYNTDNLFKERNKKNEVKIEEKISVVPILYEESKWYQKIYNNILKFIKQIFNKNR